MDASSAPTDPNGPLGSNRKLYRDTSNEMIGGVASGFANYFAVDVVWVRLLFVLLAIFANGLGIVLYIAAWIIVPPAPPAPAAPPPVKTSDRSVRYWLGVGLVGLGGILLLRQIAGPLRGWLPFDIIGDLVFPMILIGIGIAVWRASRKPADAAATDDPLPPPPTEPTFEGRVERFAQTVETGITDIANRVEAAVEAHYAGSAGRRVSRMTFAVALITFGCLWLASTAGVTGLTVPRILAITLLILGIGSLVGAFIGRGHGIIPIGVLVSIAVLVTSAAVAVFPDGTRDAVFGSSPGVYAEDVLIAPDDMAALEDEYTFGNGRVVIDLRDIDRDAFADAEVTQVMITMGVGDLHVRVPDGIQVTVDVSLGVGVIEVGGARVTGWQATHNFTDTLRSEHPSDGTLALTISQAVGRVEVSR